jgi:hypothetical protein
MSVDGDSISEVSVDQRPQGLRAVYLVETCDSEEAHAVARVFADLESRIQVRRLCTGKLVSYAVQVHDSDSSVLDEMEVMLKGNYSFVVTQRSFDEIIYRIIAELCSDTSSKLLPVPRCCICGRTEPFPSVIVNLSDERGRVRLCRNYCASCAASATATSNKEFVRTLLTSDRRRIRGIERAQLVRRRSRTQPIRWRVILNSIEEPSHRVPDAESSSA